MNTMRSLTLLSLFAGAALAQSTGPSAVSGEGTGTQAPHVPTPTGTATCADTWQASGTTPDPILLITESGFINGASPNVFRVAFDNPTIYSLQSSYMVGDAATGVLQGVSPANLCYNRYHIDVNWGDLAGSGQVLFDTGTVGKTVASIEVRVENERTVELGTSGFRGNPTENIQVDQSFVVQAEFFTLLTAQKTGFNVFQAPNLAFAVLALDAEVSSLSTLASELTINVITELQYPFEVVASDVDAGLQPVLNLVSSTYDADNAGLALSFSDCAPVTTPPEVVNEVPDNALACRQQWVFKVVPDAGFVGTVCEYDFSASIDFHPTCRAEFPSDCPVKDAQRADFKSTVAFSVDTANFCPQLVDTVDVSTLLNAYTDAARTSAATNWAVSPSSVTNFIYWTMTASSTEATVTSVTLDHVRAILTTGDPPVESATSKVIDPALPPSDLAGWGSADSPAASGANNVLHFEWQLHDDEFFDPATHGATGDEAVHFNVYATFTITYTGSSLLEGSYQSTVELLASASKSASAQASLAVRIPSDGPSGQQPSSSAGRLSTLIVATLVSGVCAIVSL